MLLPLFYSVYYNWQSETHLYQQLESVANTFHITNSSLQATSINPPPASPLVNSINPPPASPLVKLAVVCCSSRLEEASVLFKSSILLTTSPLHLIILTDRPLLHVTTLMTPLITSRTDLPITYEVIPPHYPSNLPPSFKEFGYGVCASLRLFLPSLLPHHDSVIYMDSDTLLVQPPSTIWDQFSSMEPPALMGLVEEHPTSPHRSVYGCCSKLPSPSTSGLNSGIILMKLKQLRETNIETVFTSIWVVSDHQLIFHDQDVLNIFFHFHPSLLLPLSPKFNFRPDQCLDDDFSDNLVTVVHGNRGCFHPDTIAKVAKSVSNLVHWVVHKNAYILLYALRIFPVVNNKISQHQQVFSYINQRTMEEMDKNVLQQYSQANRLCKQRT